MLSLEQQINPVMELDEASEAYILQLSVFDHQKQSDQLCEVQVLRVLGLRDQAEEACIVVKRMLVKERKVLACEIKLASLQRCSNSTEDILASCKQAKLIEHDGEHGSFDEKTGLLDLLDRQGVHADLNQSLGVQQRLFINCKVGRTEIKRDFLLELTEIVRLPDIGVSVDKERRLFLNRRVHVACKLEVEPHLTGQFVFEDDLH